MLKVQDIMIHEVYTAHKDDLVRTVLEKFVTHKISGMPIVDNEHRLVGYISDGDIMRFLGGHMNQEITTWTAVLSYYYVVSPNSPDDPPELSEDEFEKNALYVCNKPVLDVGVSKVITVRADDDLVHVANTLSKRKIKKVPVVHDHILMGIVSRGDVVRAVVQKVLCETTPTN